jgi:hypothetical protein
VLVERGVARMGAKAWYVEKKRILSESNRG